MQISSNARIHGFAFARTLHSLTAPQMDAGPSRTGAPLRVRGSVSCHKTSRVARLALLPSRIANSGLRLFTHAGKSYACACFWRTVMAPRFLFGFQHCREGVRALSGAGMGLSETPEPIATHNDLCFPRGEGTCHLWVRHTPSSPHIDGSQAGAAHALAFPPRGAPGQLSPNMSAMRRWQH